jgi:hypothetical protein
MFFHWVKGVPFDDNGKYDRLTLWEQIDQGVQGTPNRKFLTFVPAVLFAVAIPATQEGRLLIPVVVLGLINMIAKLPQLYKVRILGINKW